jgi:SNF2 family DNA or RNA helicase
VLASLRLVVLRRTKEQVAADLPARTEQTLSVEPSRRSAGSMTVCSDRIVGAFSSASTVWCRAREDAHPRGAAGLQAARSPALVDPSLSEEASAGHALLLRSRDIAQGHKALVFSQFTSFALVRATRRRRLRVSRRTRARPAVARDRFQNDAACPLFLISPGRRTRAQLTAADYVYLLDPWWNPAVEAQAIDARIASGRRAE